MTIRATNQRLAVIKSYYRWNIITILVYPFVAPRVEKKYSALFFLMTAHSFHKSHGWGRSLAFSLSLLNWQNVVNDKFRDVMCRSLLCVDIETTAARRSSLFISFRFCSLSFLTFWFVFFSNQLQNFQLFWFSFLNKIPFRHCRLFPSLNFCFVS